MSECSACGAAIESGNLCVDCAADQILTGAPKESPKAARRNKKAYLRWTEQMEKQLVDMVDSGRSVALMAQTLKIPADKVRSKLKQMQVKLSQLPKPPKAEPVVPQYAVAEEGEPQPLVIVPCEPDPKPDKQIDRVIYLALDQLAMEVVDLDPDWDLPDCWREILAEIDMFAAADADFIKRHPAAEDKIAELIALRVLDRRMDDVVSET